MDRDESIYKLLNLVKIKSEVSLAKEKNIPLSVIKFKCEVDLGNSFHFKDIFEEIYKFLHFPLFLYGGSDSFLIFLRDMRLHESIVVFKKLQRKLLNEYDIKIDKVGISELHKDDSADELLERVHKYFVISKRVPQERIIYGTREFDFYNVEKREENLKVIFTQNPNITIYNIYEGIPIKERAVIVGYDNEVICFKTSRKRVSYLQKNEKFLYIKHEDFPSIIRGEIAKLDLNREIVCVHNLDFQDSSVIDRESIRVKPPKTIKVMIEFDKKMIADGEIESISVDSVVVKMDKNQIKKFKKIKNREFILKFRLFAKNSIAVDNISLNSKIFNILEDEGEIVFLIKPNSYTKMKISGYIEACEEEILKTLKIKNRL